MCAPQKGTAATQDGAAAVWSHRRLKQVLHTELDNSGIDAGGCNLAKRLAQSEYWIAELRVVERVEELSAEDQYLALSDPGGFHD